MILLTPNLHPLRWKQVLYHDGTYVSLELMPKEGWFDARGHLRFFSHTFGDGTVGNYKLLPRNQAVDMVIRLAEDWLVPFGVRFAAHGLSLGDHRVYSVAVEVLSRYAEVKVKDYLEGVRLANSVYYDIENGWSTIVQPLRAE